jgi:two-component system, NarL family, response regulator LiaR
MIEVAIIDNDKLVCELLEARLGREDDFKYAGAAGSADAALKLVRDVQPDLIVLDLMLAGGPDPISLASRLASLSPRSQIIVCTSWSDEWHYDRDAELRLKVRASRSGVTDWVKKSAGIDQLITRLRAAGQRRPARQGPRNPLEEQLHDSLQNAEAIVARSPMGRDATDLTPMERRVAAAVARGLEADMTVDDVCRLRNLNTANVRSHLKNIYDKWNVSRQPAFVAEARRRGLLDDR